MNDAINPGIISAPAPLLSSWPSHVPWPTRFTPDQVKQLNAPLDGSVVVQRKQSGQTLSYIEGWWAIAEANRIFGFDGWNRETISMECVRAPEEVTNSYGKKTWRVGFMAKVLITVGTIKREGTGFGSGAMGDLGEAVESAVKEAETDAMKRALMTFGNPFGLALYDKSRANVVEHSADDASTASGKPVDADPLADEPEEPRKQKAAPEPAKASDDPLDDADNIKEASVDDDRVIVKGDQDKWSDVGSDQWKVSADLLVALISKMNTMPFLVSLYKKNEATINAMKKHAPDQHKAVDAAFKARKETLFKKD